MVAEAQLPCARPHRARRAFRRARSRRPRRRCCRRRSDEVDPLARGLALDRREALGDDQLVRNAQQRVEQAGAARVGIFLDAEDAGEAACRRARAPPSRRARS